MKGESVALGEGVNLDIEYVNHKYEDFIDPASDLVVFVTGGNDIISKDLSVSANEHWENVKA